MDPTFQAVNTGLRSSDRASPLCAKHLDVYHQTPAVHPCHISGCKQNGLAFPANEGMLYERTDHAKSRLLNSTRPATGDGKRHSWKQLRDDSPPMPHLEAIEGPRAPRRDPSNLSLTVSTASNRDDLDDRLKDLGGRRKSVNDVVPSPKVFLRPSPSNPHHPSLTVAYLLRIDVRLHRGTRSWNAPHSKRNKAQVGRNQGLHLN